MAIAGTVRAAMHEVAPLLPIRNMKVSATWSDTPAEPTRLAPRLNQHGAEILREAGFSADEIATLIREGVTTTAPDTPQD